MAVGQKIIPYKGVELDNHELNVDDMKATFMKNFTNEVNDNNRISQDEGSNAFIFTPLESNEPYCNLLLPAGTNYCCGFFYAKEINQAYIFGHNSNSNHFIYRIFGDSGGCEMVLINSCLGFKLEPKLFISEGRATVQIATRFNKTTGKQERVVYILFTNNDVDQKFICPDDLVATNGYDSASFPYFETSDPDCEKCTWFNLGRPTPMGCINVTPVARNLDDATEKTKPNLLNYKGWQFRTKEIDQYGRSSEHGIISETYFNQIGNSCLANSSGLPRCLRLRFPAGCPLVNQIQLSFRNCAGNTKGLSTVSDWYRFTLFNKYNDCESNNWWERTISNPWQVEYDAQIDDGATADEAEAAAYAKGLTRYHPEDNTFEYTFCADKECAPISVTETNRVENPLPLTSGTIFPLNKSIALGRNKRGFEPMDCNELNKIEFSTQSPETNSCSRVELRKIKIWGLFYNPNNEGTTRIRVKDDKTVFGLSDCSNNNPINFDQILPTGQEGIIGHLKGTDYYAISKQYKYDRETDLAEFVGLTWTLDPGSLFDLGRYFAIQVWELNVLPGKYRFHLASHKSAPSDDYKSTSTYFIGRTSLANPGELVEEQRELIIDVCENDFELRDTPIMIWDLTHEGKNCTTSSEAASSVAGYMYEDEIEKRPIEMAVVTTNHDDGVFDFVDVHKSTYTDHNGFYFATRNGRTLRATIRGYKNCALNQVLATGQTTRDTVENWFKFDKLYAYKNLTPYPVGDRMIIKGRITLCGSPSIGLPGVGVNLTRGGYAVTDANGEYRIVMHDIGNTAVRSENLIISQRGACQILACQDACSFCFANIPVNRINCTGSARTINVAPVSARINVVNSKGPKMGGRYGVGLYLYDWMGRRSFLQATDKFYVDIPSMQQTQVYDFSKILFNLNGAVFPSWTKKVTFAFTENLNWDDDLVWVMERVQFVDNTGKTNTAAPTQIRLYYESLNEYNKQNDFSTNSTWQFLTTENNSVTGDVIEFLANADGSIFTSRITALAKYNKEGRYIQIDYTDDLKDLKDGTLVKLLRPKQCENKEFYYEICPAIRIVNQQAVTQTGILNFFDSYLLYRQIPVPVLIKPEITADNGDIIQTSVTENQITAYPFFFEHNSPSDTWGDHCSNKGRVGVKNPQEKERLIRMSIAVSNALVNDGLLNGLHYFEEKDEIVLDEQEWGGINICLAEINTILVICEFDNLVLTYNDNAVTTDESGNVVAPSGDRRFGRPERKIGNNFGCQLDDVNTIRKKDGLVLFLDSSKVALVKHNYAEGQDISIGSDTKGGFKSYISAIVKSVLDYNNSHDDKKFFHGVIDPKKKDYLLTTVNLAQNSNSYVNNRPEVVIGANDTAAINIYTGTLRFNSFTPEYFGSMEGDKNDQQLISFRFAEAWRHNKLNNPSNTYNTFFGIQVDEWLEVVFNIDNTKVKNPMWSEVYCPQKLFFIDRIISESGQVSRVMPLWWERRNKFWSADFKCAINTQADTNLPTETGVNALLDGDMLYGRWFRVRYKGIAAGRGIYFELTAIIGFVNGAEKSSDK